MCLDEPEDPSIGFGFSRLTYLEQEYSLYACTQLLGMIIHAEQKDFYQPKKIISYYFAKFFSFEILKKPFSKLQIST